MNTMLKTYGKEDFEKAMNSFSKPNRHVCLLNRYCSADSRKELANQIGQKVEQCEFLKLPCLYSLDNEDILPKNASLLEFPKPFIDKSSGLLSHYCLDLASLFPPKMLSPAPGDKILDICGAPGGKALVLAQFLFNFNNFDGYLVVNEYLKSRRDRLDSVLKSYLPESVFTDGKVQITGHDGRKCFGKFMRELNDLDFNFCAEGLFDKVLVDVPCSSERHIIHHRKTQPDRPPALPTPRQSKQLAMLQLDILKEAWKCCKLGGKIVYSTCSVSEYENDGVIEDFLKWWRLERLRIKEFLKKRNDIAKKPPKARLEKCIETYGRPTKYGYMICPYGDAGWGPIYYAIITKN